jgi:Holliday junction resolvase RusA-like endonuclease
MYQIQARQSTISGESVVERRYAKPALCRQVRTPESRAYDQRIASIALAAVTIARWKMPDHVCVDVTIANIRADRENVLKEIHDPLQGIVFAHDSRILDGRTIRLKDDGGPRVILHVRAVDGKEYGFTAPRKSALPMSRPKVR